jgi:Calcineurin-like phosphoesterase/Purple acid Phosphatase, N-terminal domain
MPVDSSRSFRWLLVCTGGLAVSLLSRGPGPGTALGADSNSKPAESKAADANASDSKDSDTKGSDDTGEKREDFAEKHRIPKGGPYALPGETGTFLRAPYLQCATPTSISIVWRTLKPLTSPLVRYGSASGTLDRIAEGTAITLRRLAEEGERDRPLYSAPIGTRQYEARITGLTPDARFFYGVFEGESRLTADDGTYFFRTLPATGTQRNCLFWIVGDSGTGQQKSKTVHHAMRDWLKDKNLELDLYTHVGDMAYNNGKDLEFTDNFFKVYDETLRQTVCFPALGNHEGHSSNGNMQIGPYFDGYICPSEGQSGGEPSGTEAYYSYNFGRAHFIALNSHDADRRTGAAMARWLKEDLDKVQPAQTDWVLAYWHHPPYTKGSHNSDKEVQLVEMRKYIIPILDSHGVDLAFTGHSHIYERSMLIDGAYGTPTTAGKDATSGEFVVLDDGDGNPLRDGAYRKSAGLNDHEGIIHIVAGNGGTKNVAKFGGACPVMKKVSLDHGSVLVSIQGRTLTATMLTYQGKEVDTFQIIKDGHVTPHRIENPDGVRESLTRNATPEPVPAGAVDILPLGFQWRCLAGSDPSSDDWVKLTFNDSGWKLGRAGFGYNYPNNKTELSNMRGRYQRIYLRGEFVLESTEDADKLGLAITYDDGFIAYLNGEEVARRNIVGGSGKDVGDIQRVEKANREFFPLAAARDKFRLGKNILAIEGHNDRKDSNDFTLDPTLLKKK